MRGGVGAGLACAGQCGCGPGISACADLYCTYNSAGETGTWGRSQSTHAPIYVCIHKDIGIYVLCIHTPLLGTQGRGDAHKIYIKIYVYMYYT